MFKFNNVCMFLMVFLGATLINAATGLSEVGKANYFVLHNKTDNDLQVKSTSTDGNVIDTTLSVNGYTVLFPVDMTASLSVKKIGKNPLHREHEVDLKKATELYFDDAFNLLSSQAKGNRGVRVTVTGKLVGVDIVIGYDK